MVMTREDAARAVQDMLHRRLMFGREWELGDPTRGNTGNGVSDLQFRENTQALETALAALREKGA